MGSGLYFHSTGMGANMKIHACRQMYRDKLMNMSHVFKACHRVDLIIILILAKVNVELRRVHTTLTLRVFAFTIC